MPIPYPLRSGTRLSTFIALSVVFLVTAASARPIDDRFPEEEPPPPVPSFLNGPGTDADGNYTLSWGSSFLANRYVLQEYVASWATVFSGNSTSFAVQNRAPGQYRYRVKACNFGGGCSMYTPYITVTVTQPSPPPTPGAITAPSTDDDGAFSVSWGASSGASSYTLQRQASGGSFGTVYSGSGTSYNQGGLGNGSYGYRARACNANGCSGWTATRTVTVDIPVADPSTPAPFNDPGPSAASDQIGTIEGSFRVNESGAATYSIPITAAAGTAGVVPTVSLNYASTTQNGIAGVGWSVSGTSAISRCRQTPEQDRDALPMTWTSSDRFCLDGRRLMMVSGSSYGAANSTYRTEIDSGAVVTVVGNVSGEPNYFEVWRKDGSTSYYGRTPANASEQAKLKAGNGKTLTWGIREYQDSVGNSIWFEYESASGAQRISNIRYAYGSNAGPGGNNARINFVYQTRSDVVSGWVAGYEFKNDKRLSRIRSYNTIGGAEYLIRDYVLRYGEGHSGMVDKLSRLTSVQECANGACLPKTTFAWRLPRASTGFQTIATLTANSNYSGLTPVDINGDSMIDLVWFEGGNSTKYLRYALATGSGFVKKTFSNGSYSLALPVGSSPKQLQPIDYNLDGRQDVAYFDNNQRRWRIVLSEPHGNAQWRLRSSTISTPLVFSSSQSGDVVFTDVDSNGTTDAVYRSGFYDSQISIRKLERNQAAPDSSATAYYFGNAFSPAGSYTDYMVGDLVGVAPDFNGDGQVDILINGYDYNCRSEINGNNCYIVNSNRRAVVLNGVAAGSPSVTSYYNFGYSGGYPDIKDTQTVDVNADGLSDAFFPVIGTSGYKLRINRGNGSFTLQSISDSSLADDAARPAFVDWNQDGYPDLLWKDRPGGSIRARYWNPQTQLLDPAVVVSWYPSTNSREIALYFDMNGDASPDILYVNRNGTLGSLQAHKRTYGENDASNRIKSITNGLGAVTSITYEPLSTTDHYDRLELTTSTGTEEFCIEDRELDIEFCHDREVQVPNAGEFYSQINGPWDLPTGAQSLGKNSPVMEMGGAYYVVTDVVGSAPRAGTSPNSVNHSATATISYRYGEAKAQAAGRGFLGFERLTTVDQQSGVETTTYYRQDWPFVGNPIATEVRTSAGHLLSSTATSWKIREWSTIYQSTYQQSGSAAAGPIHIVESSNLERTYDLVNNGASAGSLLSTVSTTMMHDAEANAEIVTVTTKDDIGAVLKFVHTTNEYYDTATFPLREGRLYRTTVLTSRQGETSPLVRVSTFTYHTTAPWKGLLASETIEPDNTALRLASVYSYDTWGNRVRSKQVTSGQTRCNVNTVTYDSIGRYPTVERDCLGRTTSTVAGRNAFGQPTRVDVNLGSGGVLTKRTAYGAFGRPYYAWDETGASRTTYLSAPNSNCPSGTVFMSAETGADGAKTAKCIDKLGRTVRQLSLAFDGTWNAQDTEFDEFGRTKRRSEPFNLTWDGPSTLLWSTFSHDLHGRVTATSLPDGSSGSIVYSGYSKTETNDLGQSKTEVRNALGELTDVYDNLGGHTTYEYDHRGNVKLVRDNAGNETRSKFDLLGRKEWTDDPDKGLWRYEYTSFGELKKQTDAKNQTSTMTYDGLGRIKTRVDRTATGSIESNTVWTYDTAPYGLGQLDYVQDQVSGYHKAFLYDGLGRSDEVVTTIEGSVYYEKTTYDAYGRVYEVYDAAGNGSFTDYGIRNRYNVYGHLESIEDAVNVNGSPRMIYQKIEAMNARGQVTVEKRGIPAGSTSAAVSVGYEYWAATGHMKSISAVNRQGQEVQDLQYLWDTVGNLSSRKEYSGAKNLSESFGYDGLNRLTSYGPSTNRVTVTYDPMHLGNILTKSDTSGTYQFGTTGAGPHAVSRFNGSNYYYDGNGNNTSGGGRSISYTTFDKAKSISKGGHTTQFKYGPDRSRYKRTDNGGSGLISTFYIGNVEIEHKPTGHKLVRRHIGGVALETITTYGGSTTGRETRFLFHDHLGSLDVITNSAGTIAQELSFDAWGKRRNASNWLALSTSQLVTFNHSITTRGFTGHEMLDEVGIIHMNGRIYDPNMGRFLQADPFVQDPTNSQNLNRYSYVWNNPLNATDPSGYFIFTLIAMALVAADIVGAVVAFAVAGFLDAIVAGADFADAFLSGIISGLSAAAFSAVGEALGNGFQGNFAGGLTGEGFAIKVFAHGAIGGITSVMQGGKFGHGFASAFATASATSFNNSKFIGKAGFSKLRVVVGAAIGGSVSKLSGGKFANGAITGAFSQALNNEGMEKRKAEYERRSLTAWLDEKILEFFIEHDLPSVPQGVADGITGFGDGAYSAVTLGIGDLGEIRGALGIDGGIDYSSTAYNVSELAGGITGGVALGGSIGMLGRGRAGFEYSHFVPQRYLNGFGITRAWRPALNGTYVPRWYHAATDAYRYRFVPRSLKAFWGRTSPVPQGVQQVLRVPPAYVGGGLGATVGD